MLPARHNLPISLPAFFFLIVISHLLCLPVPCWDLFFFFLNPTTGRSAGLQEALLLLRNSQEENLLLFGCVFTTSGGIILQNNDPLSPRLQSVVNYKLPAVRGLLFNCLQFVEV